MKVFCVFTCVSMCMLSYLFGYVSVVAVAAASLRNEYLLFLFKLWFLSQLSSMPVMLVQLCPGTEMDSGA